MVKSMNSGKKMNGTGNVNIGKPMNQKGGGGAGGRAVNRTRTTQKRGKK